MHPAPLRDRLRVAPDLQEGIVVDCYCVSALSYSVLVPHTVQHVLYCIVSYRYSPCGRPTRSHSLAARTEAAASRIASQTQYHSQITRTHAYFFCGMDACTLLLLLSEIAEHGAVHAVFSPLHDFSRVGLAAYIPRLPKRSTTINICISEYQLRQPYVADK